MQSVKTKNLVMPKFECKQRSLCQVVINNTFKWLKKNMAKFLDNQESLF